MSRFFSSNYKDLVPYTPGEQPQGGSFVKLNTNESPFAPPQKVMEAVAAARSLNLYSDPTCRELREKLAAYYGVEAGNVIVNNGSDETLLFAFEAFTGPEKGAAFADLTYGFYPVFAQFTGADAIEIPLKDDFTIDINDYMNLGRTIFIANPNAPTGICLPVSDIEKIVAANPDSVVVVDEAYVDFGGESCVPLTHKYDNLLVVMTFSKSRSMAGARLGFGIGNESLINDLNTIRYSTNPYNLDSMALAAGCAMLDCREEVECNCWMIMENRSYTKIYLEEMGFFVTDSSANFLFIRHPDIPGEELYLSLKDMGILVRHFDKERIRDFNRVTVGTREQMNTFLDAVRKILADRA